MTTPTAAAATAAADPTPCAECHGTGFDPDCSGHPTAAGRVWCECPDCDDPDGGDDCRVGDDVAESAPDDATRFALVARHFPAAA